MIEPAKLSAPITPVSIDRERHDRRSNSFVAVDALDRIRPIATSAAAPPPAPLKSATICGIAVILTARPE